jgi:acetyltransferase-like isoleucine patch superfamily enzyme
MKRFAIYGVNGCGRGVLPLVRQELQASLERGLCDLVFVDDHPPASVVNGHRVLTYEQWLSEPASSRHMNVAIANSQVREKLVQRCATDGVRFFQARAANVVQLDDVQIGEGAVLCPFVTLTSNISTNRTGTINIFSGTANTAALASKISGADSAAVNKVKTYNTGLAAFEAGATSGARNIGYRQAVGVTVSNLVANNKTYDRSTSASINTA